MPERRAEPVRVVLATRNAHKVEELRAILAPLLPSVELLPLPDHAPDPVEDADDFEGNALLKARSAVAATGLPALADDSGIAVAALGGAPGIHSARYAGTRDDGDNVLLLLRNLDGEADRRAVFVCAAAYVDPDGTELVELGELRGEVLLEPVGDGGFGYDPVFRPDGADRSLAEFGADEKNAISHRVRAFGALAAAIAAR